MPHHKDAQFGKMDAQFAALTGALNHELEQDFPGAHLGFAAPSGTQQADRRTHMQHIIDALHNAEVAEKLMLQLSVELTGEVPAQKANAADMPQPEPEGLFPQLGEAGRRINACLSTVASLVTHIRGSL